MNLGIIEDFSIKNIYLDSELTSPSCGVFLNQGVNPLITLKTLLDCLPKDCFTASEWSDEISYVKYEGSFSSIVSHNDSVWQCLEDNLDSEPTDLNSNWLKTSMESLRIKSFIARVEQRFYSMLDCDRRLIENQYLYDQGEKTEHELPNDYSGIEIEAKGDYIRIKINEVSFEKSDSLPANLYVINDNQLVDTISLVTSGDSVVFQDVDYVYEGKGYLRLVVDSTIIKRGKGSYDSLKYKGFTIKSINGKGSTPNDCEWSDEVRGVGLGINVSIEASSSKYISNNCYQFSKAFRSVFEYMCFELFMTTIRQSQTTMNLDASYLERELKVLDGMTVARSMSEGVSRAKGMLSDTFDKLLARKPKYRRSTL